MADIPNGGKAAQQLMTTEEKVSQRHCSLTQTAANSWQLRFVFLLLMHQKLPSINYDGFDIGTGHSKVAMGGLVTRMRKQFR
jgi:hypothetical protein